MVFLANAVTFYAVVEVVVELAVAYATLTIVVAILAIKVTAVDPTDESLYD